MINDQPRKPGGSIQLGSIEKCPHITDLSPVISPLNQFFGPFSTSLALWPLGAPHGRIWPSTSFERPTAKWWLDDPPKVAGYTTFPEIAALATPSPVSHDMMFWSWGKICPKPIQVAKNLPHAARLLDSPRATCYFLQPHSNWMNHNAATSAFQMEKLDRKSGKFLSSICIPSWKYWWINHGITSSWNHDTR